uniref:Ninjurin-2 n=1 Tax=Astyanax mexicanus TaxID=7994 RepID=A0A8B9HFF6_ASTMX
MLHQQQFKKRRRLTLHVSEEACASLHPPGVGASLVIGLLNWGECSWNPAAPLNMNHYATKKTVAESMLDVALLMANASQLKAVVEQGPDFKYYITVIVLISVSLFFQVIVGALFVVMARKDLNNVANQRKLDIINNVATVLVFLTVIINIFITAFGVQKTGLYPQQ